VFKNCKRFHGGWVVSFSLTQKMKPLSFWGGVLSLPLLQNETAYIFGGCLSFPLPQPIRISSHFY